MLGQLAAVAEAGGPALVGAMATHAWQTTRDTRWPVCSAAADRPCRPLWERYAAQNSKQLRGVSSYRFS